MSHFTTIEIEIRDIEALEYTCEELGVGLEKNAEARGFGNNRRKADYVIRLNGPYDVALNKQSDGSYKVETDLWNKSVEKELGSGLGRLKQMYAVNKATREARRKGYSVTKEVLPNKNIRLRVMSLA